MDAEISVANAIRLLLAVIDAAIEENLEYSSADSESVLEGEASCPDPGIHGTRLPLELFCRDGK